MRRAQRNKKIKLRQRLALKGAARAMKIAVQRLLRLKADRKAEAYSSFDNLIEALLGGARTSNVIGFRRGCKEPVYERVRALPGLAARCIIDDGAARPADPFSDSFAEPMDVEPMTMEMEPEPMETEPAPMDTDSEPMYMESQSLNVAVIVTCIYISLPIDSTLIYPG